MNKMIIGLLLAATSSCVFADTLPGLSGSETSQATKKQCEEAWVQSSAFKTCGSRSDAWADIGDNCFISTECHTTETGGWKQTHIITSLAGVRNLSNCNGTLTVGPC